MKPSVTSVTKHRFEPETQIVPMALLENDKTNLAMHLKISAFI